MANGNTTPNRPGQLNATGDDRALFLKQFSGEILTAFHNRTATLDKHLVRTITSGKSASFPVTGSATAAYHTPGTRISDVANGLLSTIRHGEKVINIDDLLISSTFIANIDELMNHFDVRSIYADELGTALALRWDGNVIRQIIKAARVATADYTGGPVGSVLKKGATVETSGSALAAAIYEAGTVMDEKNVPTEDRYAFVRPDQYSLLTQTTDLLNKDWGGSGSYSDGKIYRINGIAIVSTNQLPSTNETTQASGDKNGYNGDFTSTVAVVSQKRAVGTVKLLDLATESEYSVDLQGTLFVAKYAVGHGVLRQDCAVEISKASA